MVTDSTSTDYLLSGQIHFTGLGSGTDFDTVIQKLVKIETNQFVKPLEDWKKTWEDRVSAFQDLNTAMLTLKNNLEGMDSIEEFFVKQASSSDESVLTATASSEASVGSHNIVVNQLAQNDVLVSKSFFNSSDAVVNSTGSDETFSYTYNGTTVNLTISDGTTLNQMVKMINNDPNNPGIRANILQKTDGEYYLQLTGLDLGANYTITINDAPSSFDADSSGSVDNTDFDHPQVAQNAQIQIDGYPNDGTWIERQTNSIDDVLTGVTLNLKNIGSAQIDLSNDTEAITEQVKKFVDSVNKVLELIKEQTKVTTGSNNKVVGSVLTGNYGPRLINDKIKNILASKGLGFDYDLDPYTSLASIGITTDALEGSPTFGELKFDESKFQQALQANPEAVAEIFSADYTPDVSSNDFSYHSHIDGITNPGEYEVEYTVSSGVITSATIGGYTASVNGNVLTALDGDGKGLAIEVNNLTDGTYTGTIRLKYGKTLELKDALDELTDPLDGVLNILKKNYKDFIQDLDDKIAWQQERISEYERHLKDKFARLETVLGYYNAINMQLSSQIASLSTKSK